MAEGWRTVIRKMQSLEAPGEPDRWAIVTDWGTAPLLGLVTPDISIDYVPHQARQDSHLQIIFLL
jgi:hypothetical protein